MSTQCAALQGRRDGGCSPPQPTCGFQPLALWHGLAIRKKRGRIVKSHQTLAADVFQTRSNISNCSIANEGGHPPLPLPREGHGAAPNEALGQSNSFYSPFLWRKAILEPQLLGCHLHEPPGACRQRGGAVGEQHEAGWRQHGAMGRNETPAAAFYPVRL